ncbi:DMT family transporter [Arthrobacter sp. PAMC 25486]|uniref:DMT family transporter n=1 Tax=Arthrobacter sp. PAMC 25486 TaxID=1494608 RepID=UPI00056F5D50|nr:DMT family transporter [Arthrobacter sp. PAMC 25486]
MTRVGMVIRFCMLGLAWGSSFLMMKLAVGGLSPGQVVLGRLGLGALTLCLLLVLTRRAWPRHPKLWLHLAVTAGIGCVLPFLLFAWAAERIPSGLSSVLNSGTPLATAVVTAVALRQEKVTLRKASGIVIGAVGILVVLSPWRFYSAGAIDLWGQLACLGAVLCFGIVFSYTKKYVSAYGADPIGVPAVQMLLAALMMLVLAPFIATGPVSITVPVIIGMLLLGIVSTGLAYVWNFQIIAQWGATAASTVAYITPLVGVALGALVLREEISWNQIIGAGVVIGGIVLGQSGSGALQQTLVMKKEAAK